MNQPTENRSTFNICIKFGTLIKSRQLLIL